MMETKRNEYIDFLRGVGALGIIAIHTSFWSGEGYTPLWFHNMSLLIDVPFFFFLSGWASSYRKIDVEKMLKSLVKMWGKWIFFLIYFEILSLFFDLFFNMSHSPSGLTSTRDFFNNAAFHVSFSGFPVVQGSIWFMPIYYVVVFLNTVILAFLYKYDAYERNSQIYLYILVILFFWGYSGNSFLGLGINWIVFYGAFWMMGYCYKDRNISLNRMLLFILGVMVIVLLTNYIQNLELPDIQNAKFPPSPKYGVISLISLEVSLFFKNRIKPNMLYHIFSHIGRNAIFYYFGQGIGSSIISYYVLYVNIYNWFLKWLGAFFINVVITMICAESMSFFYKYLGNMTKQLYEICAKKNEYL